jgi:thiamine biosynthesis lipoprotein
VSAEAHRSFACFGGTVSIHVRAVDAVAGERAAERCRELLLAAHRSLSRFDAGSELSRLNRDPREAVPASPLLLGLAAAVRDAGELTGGLVDGTLLGEIERAGYRRSLSGAESPVPPLPLAEAMTAAPRQPAGPSPAAGWRRVSVDAATACVVRPPGVCLDPGGLAKGLLADRLAAALASHPAFAIDCCGDVRVGGSAGLARRLLVEDPFGGPPLHELALRAGAAATSGIGRRCWRRADGSPAHHLLDPARGEPAFTGVVQATALAPSALLAEIYAKAALLSGPERGREWLPHGGVLVDDEGGARVIAGRAPLAAAVAT